MIFKVVGGTEHANQKSVSQNCDDPIFAVIEEHRKARASHDAGMAEADRLIELAKRTVGPRELDREAFDMITGDVDAFTDQTFKGLADAQEEFAETVPTTMAGLLAMVIYAHEIKERDPGAFCLYDEQLLSTLATAARLQRIQTRR